MLPPHRRGARVTRVVGVLSWYDESASWVGAAVAGMARVCDDIVAVDGAYALYPGGRPRSAPDQSEVILGTCEALGVGCVIHRPRDVWRGNEVEKRNHTLQLARALMDPAPVDDEPTDQWVLIFDSDYRVILLDDPNRVRRDLGGTDLHVATYTLLDGQDVHADEFLAAYAQSRHIDHEWTIRDRGIFRWTDDLRYVGKHWITCGTYAGEHHWLRGPDLQAGEVDKAADCLHLGRGLVVVHRRHERSKTRALAADGYYALRDELGVERVPDETAVFA